MQPTDLNIAKLSVAERIQLAEDLWDSVAADTGDLPLTDAQKAELDRRSEALDRDAAEGRALGVPWDEVLRQLRARR